MRIGPHTSTSNATTSIDRAARILKDSGDRERCARISTVFLTVPCTARRAAHDRRGNKFVEHAGDISGPLRAMPSECGSWLQLKFWRWLAQLLFALSHDFI